MTSSRLFVLQVPPHVFLMCPGLVPSGGSIPPPGFGFGCCGCSRATCNRRCLLCVRSFVVLRACRRRSECAVCYFRWIGEWGVLVPAIGITGLLWGFASDTRQRRPPATPASDARQRRPPATPPARRHDSTRNQPGDAQDLSFRSRKQPRHIALVFAAKHLRAAFWSASSALFAVLHHLICRQNKPYPHIQTHILSQVTTPAPRGALVSFVIIWLC